MLRDAYDPKFTGFMFTDAVKHMDCERCGSKAGADCRQPSGRQARTPHNERTAALVAKFGTKFWGWSGR